MNLWLGSVLQIKENLLSSNQTSLGKKGEVTEKEEKAEVFKSCLF